MTDKELIAKSQKIIMESRKELENTGIDFVDRFLSELDKAIEHIDAPTTTDKKPDGNQDKLKLNTLMDDLGDWIYSMAFKLTEVKKSYQLLNENEQLKNKKEKDKYQSIEEILFNLASILRDYCVEETKKSNERANFFMGVLYNFGICVEQDDKKAETYLERAALKNHISAQETLSQIYYLKSEFEKSAKWIKRMADQGVAEDQAVMGMYYLHGIGVEENDEIAFQWFKKAAEQNDSDGQNMLGRCYQEGWGTTKDVSEAYNWFKRAAAKGHADAQNNLAKCYHDGIGTNVDYKKSFDLFEKSARQGCSAAQYHLGYYYTYGDGIEVNMETGFKWMRKAAEQDDVGAQYNVGCCYLNGQGTEQDLCQAFIWFKKAAEGGLSEAQFMLGDCYAEGCGTDKDEIQALDWYKKAAAQGNEKAKKKLAILESPESTVTKRANVKSLDEFYHWLYKQTVDLNFLDFEEDDNFLYENFEYFLGDCLYTFEKFWNAALQQGAVHKNIYTEFVLLGMMHQVFEENNVQHKLFEEYFFEELQPAELIIQEFIETDKDILFSNKGFAALGPMALSNIMEFQKINPLFVFLIPCYEIAYYLGKARILNFYEQDYPEVDYKFYKPLKADKQKEIEKEGLYEYFDTVIKKFFNSTTIDDFASHIEKILEKCPSYDKPVFRATQIGDKETFNYFLAEYEVGNVVENFGFWSATKHYIPYDKSLVKNKEEADTQLVYMQIDGYSGKEVLYGEIIFPRHKQFLVTARRISDLNVTQIILKEIDPI